MGKFHWRPLQRLNRKQQGPDACSREPEGEVNVTRAGQENRKGVEGLAMAGMMQVGQNPSVQVWEPWMQRHFEAVGHKDLRQRLTRTKKVFQADKLAFGWRRSSHTLTRYFHSSPRDLGSPRLIGYKQQSQAQSSHRRPLASITNTPNRVCPETPTTFQRLKSVVKTPSNILKRLQGNVRMQLGKAKRLFQGGTRIAMRESLTDVLIKEGIEMGLGLEPFLRMPGQLKKSSKDDGEWEEAEVTRKPNRKVEEEMEDLMSPDWRDVKEVCAMCNYYTGSFFFSWRPQKCRFIVNQTTSSSHILLLCYGCIPNDDFLYTGLFLGSYRQSKKGACKKQVQQPSLL